MMRDADFRAGNIDIQWLERTLATLLAQPADPGATRSAVIAAVLLAERERQAPARANGSNGSAPANGARSREDAWTRVARLEALR
jgi:hypothetical protein